MFYLGFPLRGLRWQMLLRSTGQPITVKDSTEILYLSWLVNCLVPAKLGDVYRAWLLKINSPASLSRTFGTVFIERILDLFVIAILGLLAGFWSFRSGLPPEIQFVAALGVAIVVILAGLLLTLRNFGRRIIIALPFPDRVLELYDRFEEGVFSAVTFRQLPPLLVLTTFIWATEGLRLYFVVQALGFDDVSLGISGAVFVALIGSLLTAVPFSPAGLGVVDAGMGAVLVLAYGIPATEAHDDRRGGPRHQRVLDHRVRVDPVRLLGQAEGRGPVARQRRAAAASRHGLTTGGTHRDPSPGSLTPAPHTSAPHCKVVATRTHRL